MSPQMKLVAITLDCPDPPALAAFYQQATGLAPHPKSNAEFAGLNGEHGLLIGFQRVDDYRAPSWPGQVVPQQLHICFEVDEDLDDAEARLSALGASTPEHQPHGDKARVLLDPVGHPFCVIRGASAGDGR
ncbi:VOC family protein [Streptomyces sp. NPDC018610]|uniref:VOC family protein n=1 Tax=Streptomyces sp. NPDC018610 TaxID=3365049 RepID=UPI0037944403